MGRYKWERLGLEYKLGKTDAPAADGVNKAIQIFRDAGLDAF
jgi:pyruvate formate lyase activating enzyme